MNNYNNFVIFLENLSSVYILTTIVLFISVISVIFAKYFSRDISNEPTNFEGSDNDEDEENDENDEHLNRTYSKGLYGKMKSKSYLKLKKNLTKDQLLEEKAIEQEQLAAIYKLLKEQEDELETNEFNKDQLNEQLKLYR